MLNIRIKSESLPDREYVHFMYKGTPYTFTRQWKAFKDEIVLQALKEESHNFECKEKVKIIKEVPPVKEETVVTGTIKETPVKEKKETSKKSK